MNAPLNPALLDEIRAEAQGPGVQEYLRIVFRHRYAVLVLTVLFGLLGLLRSAMELPLYRSQATLLIEPRNIRYVDIRDVVGQQGTGFDYYQTQFELLKTRPLHARVADRVGPERIYKAFSAQPTLSLSKLLGRTHSETGPTPEQVRNAATAMVSGALSVNPVRGTQLVNLSFLAPEPKLAADLADALARVYVESTLEARLEMSQAAAEWLSGRLGGLREKVMDAEDRLQKFKETNNIVGAQGGNVILSQNVTLLTQRLGEQQALRLTKEAAAREIQSARAARSPIEEVASLQAHPLVSGLRTELLNLQKKRNQLAAALGPLHPEMVANQAAIDAAQTSLRRQAEAAAEAILREYQATLQVEREIRGQLEASKNELQQVSASALELLRLERDLEAARALYEKFRNQLSETSESSSMDTPTARLVNAATPSNNIVYPNTQRLVLLGALFGLVLSIALAFVLDHLDSTIKTAEAVERLIQLPVLGLVPSVKTTGSKDLSPLRYYTEQPKSAFAESLRTLRTGVLLSGLDKSHRRLLVTSSVPGEGKTTMALNLAQALAQMHKVLLVDADMRRPSVAKALGEHAPAAGLSQFIAGEVRVSECVHQLEGTNAYVMTAGVAPANPLELISSQRFQEALNSLSKVFDYIILDAPPALAVSDALVLSRQVDGVLYVVRCDGTPQAAAQAGVKRLRRVEAPLLGVVLNRVGERAHGYGYGRYSYYAEGYDQQHYGYYGETVPKKRGWFR